GEQDYSDDPDVFAVDEDGVAYGIDGRPWDDDGDQRPAVFPDPTPREPDRSLGVQGRPEAGAEGIYNGKHGTWYNWHYWAEDGGMPDRSSGYPPWGALFFVADDDVEGQIGVRNQQFVGEVAAGATEVKKGVEKLEEASIFLAFPGPEDLLLAGGLELF